MTTPTPTRDLTSITLAVLLIGGLLTASYLILQPFFVALVWGTLLVIACWPMMLGLQRRLGNRRGLAVTVMLLGLVLVIMVPITLILGALVSHAPDVSTWARNLIQNGLPAPPEWIASVPLVGAKVTEKWTALAAAGPEGLAARVQPHAEALALWFVAQAGSAGRVTFHLVLTLLVAGVLFARGEKFATSVRQFGHRLAGERGDRVIVLAAQAVRAVAMGVVVTALVQSLMGGVALVVAGLPLAGLLTAVMFMTSLAQIGAAPVLALAAVWLFVNDHYGWGVFMVVWTVLVGSLDNVIRPLLIKKGVDLPLVLLFTGVIGGLIAFGAVGLFVGPVVLAVSYTLLSAWMAEGGARPAAEAAPG